MHEWESMNDGWMDGRINEWVSVNEWTKERTSDWIDPISAALTIIDLWASLGAMRSHQKFKQEVSSLILTPFWGDV